MNIHLPNLDAFEALVARRRSSLLCDSGREVPTELIERLCRTVFAAPNHKRTVPWQLAVFLGDARQALGEALAGDLVDALPDAPQAKVDKTRTKYHRAPAIVVAGCRPDAEPLRHREDTFAVAAGIEHLLLAASAAGLTALWSSPPVTVAPRTNALASFEPDSELVGIVYVGWPTAPPPAFIRPEPVITWLGTTFPS